MLESGWGMWAFEKVAGGILIFFVALSLRACWRGARASQRAALGDMGNVKERKGLLVSNTGGLRL